VAQGLRRGGDSLDCSAGPTGESMRAWRPAHPCRAPRLLPSALLLQQRASGIELVLLVLADRG
jgi:hypothetical protein